MKKSLLTECVLEHFTQLGYAPQVIWQDTVSLREFDIHITIIDTTAMVYHRSFLEQQFDLSDPASLDAIVELVQAEIDGDGTTK